MNKKKILIILGVVLGLGLMIFLVVQAARTAEAPSGGQTEEVVVPDLPVPKVYSVQEEGDRQTLISVDPNVKPGSDMTERTYVNDFSNDSAYTPLPEGFNPETDEIQGTVYDVIWLNSTFNVFACDLANKEISTERALAVVKSMKGDVEKVRRNADNENTVASATIVLNNISAWEEKYGAYDGKVAPKNVREYTQIYCTAGDEIGH